jgi:hypothetical protein
VLAEPDSTTNQSTKATASFLEVSPLSAIELYQLTLYKWRYSLEAYGFVQHEVRELMFLKWLHASRRLQP